jgi:succinate dehydrogenase / fumarate reductase flavoprotein subunit
VVCTGSAQGSLYLQGAAYGNGEMIQVHPTCIPGEDKLRLMSESARGEGGRVWVPKTAGDKRPGKQIPENERYYFLEERYPKYGNLVPRDIATRAIHKIVYDQGMGVEGQPMVYLDLSHIDRATLDRKLGGILDIYEKFVGDDPHEVPMKIFPGMHYTMGGLWVDINQQTNIPGLYATGECDYSIHGANRLGANSLLSCIYAGFIAGPHAIKYSEGSDAAGADVEAALAAEKKRQLAKNDALVNNQGDENPFQLWRELGDTMSKNVTVTRYNDRMKETDAKLVELQERYKKVNLSDKSMWSNQSFLFARQMENMLQLARVVTQGAILRDESRGSHYKPDFPERDDERFLKTTKAFYDPANNAPRFEWEEVDISLIKPRPRRYDSK